MELISVIIPVYNVEKYLSECLDSVINQTHKNIEIILIDDGSKDSSGKICDEYAQKDTRFKVIHKENGGVSSARNIGLDMAQGRYITFVDSDDFIAPTYIEKMYNALIRNDADLVFCKYGKYYGQTINEVREVFPSKLNVKIQREEFVEFFHRFFNHKDYMFGSACRVLYKAQLLSGIRFDKRIAISEDLLFLINAILNASQIQFIEECLYFYRKTETSVTGKYKKDYLQGQLNLYHELKTIFETIDHKKGERVFHVYSALLCYYLFSNELKFKQSSRKENIQQVRKSELYKYFKLKNGLKVYGVKPKIKFLIVWFLVKTRLV